MKKVISFVLLVAFIITQIPFASVAYSTRQGAVEFGDRITFQGYDYVVNDANKTLLRIDQNGKYENVLNERYVLGIFISDDNLYANTVDSYGATNTILIVGDEYSVQLMAVAANEKPIYDFIKGNMGLNTAAACGILANLYAESGFNPNALGDNGTSYGICQWHNERWTSLKNYCNSNGYDWTTLNGQLRYLQYEITYTSEKKVLPKMQSVSNDAQGAYNAGYDWCVTFERPANSTSVGASRGNTAKNTYWPKYGGTPPVTVTPVNFTPRLTAPATNDYHYFSDNIFYQCKYGLPNCTCYAWGRAYEILGRKPSTLSTGNACTFYTKTSDGFKRGKEPKIGAIACWSGGSSGCGHVAVVEKIVNGIATTSESGWDPSRSLSSKWYFWTQNRNVNDPNFGGSSLLKFQGFIYLGDFGGPAVVKPSAPSSAWLSASDCGIGASVSADWAGVSNADKYGVTLVCTSNSAFSQGEKEVTGRSTTYVLNNPGTYRVTVRANNSAGWSDGSTQSGIITVHANSNVTFIDWDGSIIPPVQSVVWGGSAKAPIAPSRKHYDFQGWDKGFTNVTAPLTVNALYKIKKYNVRFYGYNNELLSTQSIEAMTSATPPDPKPPEGYVFIGWNSRDYEYVEQDLAIKAAYEWGNPNLPNILKITSAVRNSARDGYNVVVNLTNYPLSATRGRVVVTLKTEAGKMVAVAAETYRIDEIANNSKSIYVPYSGVATVAEASVLGIYDEDKTGVPLANIARVAVDLGLTWSDWSVNLPPTGDGIITESRTEYRIREKQTTTSTSPTLPGWPPAIRSEITGWPDYGPWSTTPVSATATRQVQTQDVHNGYNMAYFLTQTAASPYYRYYRNFSINGNYSGYGARASYGEHQNYGWWSLGNIYGAGTYGPNAWSSGTYAGKNASSVTGYTIAWDGCIWFTNGATYEKQYRYRDAIYTYTFERWGDWTGWAAGSAPAATSSREVETRTTHRFKSNDIRLTAYNYKRYVYTNLNTGNKVYTYTSAYADSMEFPGKWEYDKAYSAKPVLTVEGGITIYGAGYGENSWYAANVNNLGEVTQYITYDTLEDTNGVKRAASGTVNAPGKAATFIVYRQTNQDPLQSQLEYVDQTIIDANGGYTFNYITKEEPSDKTGDFIILLAVEGGTTPIYIGRIEAPKPLYTVIFADDDGTELAKQAVKEGDTAIAPQNPVKEGYDFIGWDNSLTNIRGDLTVAAQYKKQKFIVVFVSWDNEEIHFSEYEYGDILHLDYVPEKDGYSFAGFIDSDGRDVVTVTRNMLVTFKYNLNVYEVKFLDWGGNVISRQSVEYGGAANLSMAPVLGSPDSVKLFGEWGNLLEAMYVESDVTLYPIAKYSQTAAIPVISLASGLYAGEQSVTITCPTPGSKIIFTTDGSIPEYEVTNEGIYINGYQYYGKISLSQSTQLLAISYADGMNVSPVVFAYYDFNEPDVGNFTSTITSVINGGTAGYQIMNNSGVSYEPTVVFAIYDQTGVLVYSEINDNIILNVGVNNGAFTVPVLSGTGYKAKLFIWDRINNMTSLANVAERTII